MEGTPLYKFINQDEKMKKNEFYHFIALQSHLCFCRKGDDKSIKP